MATVRRLLLEVGFSAALALTATTPAFSQTEKRVALVIGNSTYQHVPALTNPANDAKLIAETLRVLGFSLVGNGPQLDLDEAGFRRAVQSFGNALPGAEVALFYYAGHGVQVRGSNYLVPVGANPTKEADVDFQMLDTNLVLRQMESAGARLNLVILDACRNNPFGGRGLRTAAPGLAQMQAPQGTLISFATQPGNVALDGTDGNSPYTRALAQTMRKPGLDIFRTFNEVGLAVATVTGGAQQPWVSLSPIKGDFYFAAAPAGAITTQVAPPPAQPPADPAAQAWAVTQSTTSIAVLEDFIRQFGSTIYGSMARARIDELKKSQASMLTHLPKSDSDVPPGFRGSRYLSLTGAYTGNSRVGGMINGIVANEQKRTETTQIDNARQVRLDNGKLFVGNAAVDQIDFECFRGRENVKRHPNTKEGLHMEQRCSYVMADNIFEVTSVVVLWHDNLKGAKHRSELRYFYKFAILDRGCDLLAHTHNRTVHIALKSSKTTSDGKIQATFKPTSCTLTDAK